MMMEMAMPGDELATSEEYISGDGTYEREGVIYAGVMGKPVFNESDMTVSVQEVRRNCKLKPGDMVLGEVTGVTNTIANISVSGFDHYPERWVSGEAGVIHISKVTEAYTDDVRKEYHVGDLVRARVLQAAPSLQLSSREPELGVLKARCGRCRMFMSNRSGKLFCPECDRVEHRKLAKDFGMYTPEFVESAEEQK